MGFTTCSNDDYILMNVEEVLIKENIEYRNSAADYIVRCLNVDHEDQNPSMRIDRITGIFNCFSCKFKGNIFQHFNLDINYLDIKREKLRRKIIKVITEAKGLEMPKGYISVDFDWRGISANTLIHFRAFKHKDFEDRIVFPITDIRDKIIIFIGRLIDKRSPDQVRYLIMPKHATIPLYPVPIQSINGRIIIVEGIIDLLNLWDKGLTNIICAFGINAINEEKIKLLKVMGISGIDILYDGDKAGRDGAKELEKISKELDISTKIIVLKEGTDPGDMDYNTVQKLRRYLYE